MQTLSHTKGLHMKRKWWGMVNCQKAGFTVSSLEKVEYSGFNTPILSHPHVEYGGNFQI